MRPAMKKVQAKAFTWLNRWVHFTTFGARLNLSFESQALFISSYNQSPFLQEYFTLDFLEGIAVQQCDLSLFVSQWIWIPPQDRLEKPKEHEMASLLEETRFQRTLNLKWLRKMQQSAPQRRRRVGMMQPWDRMVQLTFTDIVKQTSDLIKAVVAVSLGIWPGCAERASPRHHLSRPRRQAPAAGMDRFSSRLSNRQFSSLKLKTQINTFFMVCSIITGIQNLGIFFEGRMNTHSSHF
jgi:hypothetical protein